MARVLGAKKNVLRIRDNLSGSELELYYRMPTTEERVGYINECFHREDGEVKVQIAETRQKYGLEILEGFRVGDFEVETDDGTEVLNPDDHPAWKEHLHAGASDVLEVLATRVFEASAAVMPAAGKGGTPKK